jgi:hypothetical protein
MVMRLFGTALLMSVLLASPLPPRSANRQEAISDSREPATSAILSLNELHSLGAGRDSSATVVGDTHARVNAVHRKAQQTLCPSPSFIKVDGTYTYAQARETCAAFNYTLPMPKSLLLQLNLLGCLGNAEVWLGLTDTQSEGAFRWDDGTNLSATVYSNWFGSEPNNLNGDEE